MDAQVYHMQESESVVVSHVRARDPIPDNPERSDTRTNQEHLKTNQSDVNESGTNHPKENKTRTNTFRSSMKPLSEQTLFCLFSMTYQKNAPSQKILVAKLKTMWLIQFNETQTDTRNRQNDEHEHARCGQAGPVTDQNKGRLYLFLRCSDAGCD